MSCGRIKIFIYYTITDISHVKIHCYMNLKNHTVYFKHKHASGRYSKSFRWGKRLCYVNDIRYAFKQI